MNKTVVEDWIFIMYIMTFSQEVNISFNILLINFTYRENFSEHSCPHLLDSKINILLCFITTLICLSLGPSISASFLDCFQKKVVNFNLLSPKYFNLYIIN